MRGRIHSIVFFISIVLLFIACDDDTKIYKGKSQLELPESSLKYEYFYTDSGVTTVYIPIQIIKGTDSFDNVQVHYTSNGGNTAIIENINRHYEISSNNVKDSIPLQLNLNNITEDATFEFTLSLLDESSLDISENYRTTAVAIYKSSFIYKFVGDYECYEPENQTTYNVYFTIDSPSEQIIYNNNFWDFSEEGNNVAYFFNSNTGEIKISQEWNDLNLVSYFIEGTGNYDDTGDFTINYTISKDGEIIEEGLHYYTKK